MQRKQTDWLVSLIKQNQIKDRKTYILGKSFKPETNIQTGSPSILLNNILEESGVNAIMYDPYVDTTKPVFEQGLFYRNTAEIFERFNFPKGSIIIDPFRIINKDLNDVKVIRIGDNNEY